MWQASIGSGLPLAGQQRPRQIKMENRSQPRSIAGL
jgi:hypothetical protein